MSSNAQVVLLPFWYIGKFTSAMAQILTSNAIMHTIITDNMYEHLSWEFNVLLVGKIVGRHSKGFYVNI